MEYYALLMTYLSLEKGQRTKKLSKTMTAVLLPLWSAAQKKHKTEPEQTTVQTKTSQIHGQHHN